MMYPYHCALTTAAYTIAASHPPSSAAVRMFSLDHSDAVAAERHQDSPTAKILHLVRHAEGTHNTAEEHNTPAHLDATLTLKGIEQCRKLAKYTRNLELEAVLVSPMTRCLETARLSFPHIYGELHGNNEGNNCEHVPFIAYEEWRETVNFLCDSRRPRNILQKEYPHVNFDSIAHGHDPIWSYYENIFGPYSTYTSRRESEDALSLYNRVHSAWKVLLSRPERRLALVSHSAFFMHMFTPLFEELDGVVRYEDERVRKLMTNGIFENCEMRSVVVDVPK